MIDSNKLTEFTKAAEDANYKAAITGIEAVESVCRRLRIVLRGGAYRVPQRVALMRELQDGLGLIISAEGRQTLVEDIRSNRPTIDPPKPAPTRESLVAAVEQAAMELTRYTEDSEDDTSHDYYTGEEDLDDEGEASDDPPEARGACCTVTTVPPQPERVNPSTNPLAHPPASTYPGITVLPPVNTPAEQRALNDFFNGLFRTK